MEIKFCSHPNSNKLIIHKFLHMTQQLCCCGMCKNCRDAMKNIVTVKIIFCWILIVMEKVLEKWVHDRSYISLQFNSISIRPITTQFGMYMSQQYTASMMQNFAVKIFVIILMREKWIWGLNNCIGPIALSNKKLPVGNKISSTNFPKGKCENEQCFWYSCWFGPWYMCQIWGPFH